MIRLTDEEIQIVKDSVEKPRVPDDLVEAIELSRRLINETYDAIAEVQLKKVLNYAQTHNLDCLIPALLEEIGS